MEYQLSVFDVLERPKWPVKHVGLYLGSGQVFHCTPENGEHISTLDGFAQGEAVTVIQRGVKASVEIQQRLLERLRKVRAYSYVSNNCEHAVSRITTGKASSPQLKNIGIGALVLITAYLFIRRK